jgi:hypothetical protein
VTDRRTIISESRRDTDPRKPVTIHAEYKPVPPVSVEDFGLMAV